MEIGLNYDLKLPDEVGNILKVDFWVLLHCNRSMLPVLADPIKFTSTVSIFVKAGECRVDINLISHRIISPCIVNIRPEQILQLKFVSDDFDASFIVMSKRFCDNLFIILQDCRIYGTALRNQIAAIPPELIDDFKKLYLRIANIFSDHTNPFSYQAMILALSSFFYECGHKCYADLSLSYAKGHSRLPDKFLSLVQQHFKKERFLEFYAKKLNITTKHLSRTIKQITGFTAVEWIERYVVLEAKVLLKATNLNIQQIAEELNFPTQSLFGKYFKKNVGMTPKEFRNT